MPERDEGKLMLVPNGGCSFEMFVDEHYILAHSCCYQLHSAMLVVHPQMLST